MKKICYFIIITFCLQGCVGISIISQKDEKISTKEFQLRKDKGKFIRYNLETVTRLNWLQPKVSYSKNDILQAWGNPKVKK